jgi:hypothetical protein
VDNNEGIEDEDRDEDQSNALMTQYCGKQQEDKEGIEDRH